MAGWQLPDPANHVFSLRGRINPGFDHYLYTGWYFDIKNSTTSDALVAQHIGHFGDGICFLRFFPDAPGRRYFNIACNPGYHDRVIGIATA